MSEWKRNKRRTNGFPSGLIGKEVEARHRDGEIFTGVVGKHEWLQESHFNTSDNSEGDVMAYRILDQIEPSAPDYSKGFPVGTTAKDIGAKVGDEFVVVSKNEYYKIGENITLAKDDGTDCPLFTNGKEEWYIPSFLLAPITPKTAIELQAEEVGIAEQEWPEDRVNVIGQNGNDGLAYGIDASAERVENEAENVHIDMVNQPPHYKQGDIECIDAIRAALTEEEFRGYCKGNALKYIWRERHKGGDESLKKADWYLNKIAK